MPSNPAETPTDEKGQGYWREGAATDDDEQDKNDRQLFLRDLWDWNRRTRGPISIPIRRFMVRSHEVSKPWYLYLELSDRSEIWQAPRQ